MSCDELFRNEDAVREGMKQAIADFESLTGLERLAEGESWDDVHRSILTGRRFEPVRWL